MEEKVFKPGCFYRCIDSIEDKPNAWGKVYDLFKENGVYEAASPYSLYKGGKSYEIEQLDIEKFVQVNSIEQAIGEVLAQIDYNYCVEIEDLGEYIDMLYQKLFEVRDNSYLSKIVKNYLMNLRAEIIHEEYEARINETYEEPSKIKEFETFCEKYFRFKL